jgi:hypothetical protein
MGFAEVSGIVRAARGVSGISLGGEGELDGPRIRHVIEGKAALVQAAAIERKGHHQVALVHRHGAVAVRGAIGAFEAGDRGKEFRRSEGDIAQPRAIGDRGRGNQAAERHDRARKEPADETTIAKRAIFTAFGDHGEASWGGVESVSERNQPTSSLPEPPAGNSACFGEGKLALPTGDPRA